MVTEKITSKKQLDVAFASALPSLGLIFGHVFMWSNNLHMYDTPSILFSLMTIIVISLVLFFLNFYISTYLFNRFAYNTTINIFFYLYIALSFVFFAFSIIDYTHIIYKNKLWSPILTISFFILLYRIGPKPIACFTSVMLFLTIINFSINLVNDITNNENFTTRKTSIVLKSKPNIYLYWLESYHDFEIMKKFYGLNNDKYKKYLLDNNFTIQEQAYSSGWYTLMSFGQLYSCSDNIIKHLRTKHLDANKSVRNLIGGDKNNYVLKTLKENGYMNFFITEGRYYYTRNKGEYLDEIDLDLGMTKLLYPIRAISYFKSILAKHGFVELMFPYKSNTDVYKGDLFNRLKIAMERGSASGKPYFISFKGGSCHSPSNHVWKDRQKWIDSEIYQKRTIASDNESISIINHILKNDQNALIILIGDHGAGSYRHFPYNKSESFTKYDVSPKDIADDFFRVFFAWHLPKGIHDDISHGMYMNNSNIFMHVFAFLSGNTNILNNREPITSELGVIKMINGKLQPLP